MPRAYAVACVWYAWRRPERNTVAIAVWHDRRLLVVSHSYKRERTLPGGGARRNELPERAAARELREETGIEAAPGHLRLIERSTYTGRYGRRTTFLFELQMPARPKIRVNGWEITGGTFVGADEAPQRGVAGFIRRYVEARFADLPA
jgi:8-oxo-dGTP pyrophosphatase MutT (NUDIX family)